jgi:hypothetical protein
MSLMTGTGRSHSSPDYAKRRESSGLIGLPAHGHNIMTARLHPVHRRGWALGEGGKV